MAQRLISTTVIPPPVALMPELTDDDVRWLNGQMELLDRPPVRYAHQLDRPPIAVIYSA